MRRLTEGKRHVYLGGGVLAAEEYGMATRAICGAMTQKGTPCRWPAGGCQVHGSHQPTAPVAVPPPGEQAPPERAARQPEPGPSPPDQDLRGLGWWLIDGVLNESPEVGRASVVAPVMRVLAALGPSPLDEEAALQESAFRGRLMNGFRPHTDEEWSKVARYLDEEALAEMRRWPDLFEGDRGYRGEPLVPGDAAADEVQVAVFGEHENGG